MDTQNSPLLVMKFGGTSVGTPEAMQQVVSISELARREWQRVIVIASALSGVTDMLLESANSAAEGDTETFQSTAKTLLSRHWKIIDLLIDGLSNQNTTKQDIHSLVSGFLSLCQAITVLGETTPRALDTIVSLGERMCVRVLAGAMQSAGLPAVWVEASKLIVTDSHFQSAHPDLDATTVISHTVLDPMLDQGQIPVVTGFMAANTEGIITTLGRGGSDFSAAILAAVLEASQVWIWTDVDGVMSADPRVVPEAHTIPELTYLEVAELAYYGAKVLHPRTIRPIFERGIGLRVCNTFNPQHPGTRMINDVAEPTRGVIKAVTAITGVQLINVEGRGMLGVPGVAARTFEAVAATKTSVPLISQASSEQSICFAVPAESAVKVVSALEKAFLEEITARDIDRVWASGEVVIISVVGAGMRNTPGVSGRVFSALGSQAVNVIAIAQGSSEVSISLVVSADESVKALRAIHALID